MKDFLQGKWLGHPLHPALVHIPTALWPAALVFDVLARLGLGDGEVMARIAFYAIALGMGVALLAVPAGLADWWDIKPDKPARKLGVYHMALNVLIWALWAVNLGLRLAGPAGPAGVPAAALALSVAANALLLVSGYLGGRMVYAYGISVVRLPQAKQKWRELAEAGGANLPREQKG